MGTRAAKTLHLGLFGLGLLLYVVFILPHWWVLTGDIPRTLATAGRIAVGIPIGLAAVPVMQLLKAGLGTTPRPPEIALRLRAWSGLLYVVAGVLILLAAIAEIWITLQAAGPWLFGVYGAAGAIAILGFLAVYLSFVAEKPPAAPKAAKVKKVRADAGKKPTTKRGRKASTTESAEPVDSESVVVDETVVIDSESVVIDETVVVDETVVIDETVVVTEAAPDSDAVIVTESTVITADDETTEAAPAPVDASASGLRNKRPSGKVRRTRR